jgi:hypothetical protein
MLPRRRNWGQIAALAFRLVSVERQLCGTESCNLWYRFGVVKGHSIWFPQADTRQQPQFSLTRQLPLHLFRTWVTPRGTQV